MRQRFPPINCLGTRRTKARLGGAGGCRPARWACGGVRRCAIPSGRSPHRTRGVVGRRRATPAQHVPPAAAPRPPGPPLRHVSLTFASTTRRLLSPHPHPHPLFALPFCLPSRLPSVITPLSASRTPRRHPPFPSAWPSPPLTRRRLAVLMTT
ncbi:hypothetical protein E2C01_035456 [Portunus trituberculatus]|uniref:Uncharacterized protein n=1 Tax=Portunus trituberculatus TaxID=210409 RepID=A0A5B7F9D7_PORTR|nr:hypothetical protein [Portunus trituberculatus]